MNGPRTQVVRQTLVLTAVWTVPVIVSTAGYYFFRMVVGQAMPVIHIVGHGMAMWYVWIAATPLIFAIHRRRQQGVSSWPAAAAAHVALCLVLYVLQSWLIVTVGHQTGHVALRTTFQAYALPHLTDLLPYDVLTYGCVLAVAAGLEYARRYRDRDLRASQLETQLERAHLAALQSQLQPHFLFNALNSIATLIRRDRKKEALDSVLGFAELLRYVLDDAGTMDVRLEDELVFVRRYLAIEQLRHGERLRTVYAVAPDTLDAIVPNLVLQPLVENALKHGVSCTPSACTVTIHAERRNGMLQLSVENDGPALARNFSLTRAGGLGIRNLRDRLHSLFGDAGRVSLAQSPAGLVIASVEMPYAARSGAAMEHVS